MRLSGARFLAESLIEHGVDIAGIIKPVVKHNWIAEDVNDLAEIMREAFIDRDEKVLAIFGFPS